jgi:hypothetical protein
MGSAFHGVCLQHTGRLGNTKKRGMREYWRFDRNNIYVNKREKDAY